MARKLVVEAVGTFFLFLTIGLVVMEPASGGFAPLAIGAVLMVMVYGGAHISGAHYNPAVTLAVFLRGRATVGDLIGYPLAQVAAAVGAALLLPVLGATAGAEPLILDPVPALLAEALFTFALAYIILNVATAAGTEGNSYFGLAIGATVAGGAWAVGPLSGAAFNPAVAVGLVVTGLAAPASLWVYLAAQIAGGVAAALLFNAFDMGTDKPTTATPDQQAGLEPAAATERR